MKDESKLAAMIASEFEQQNVLLDLSFIVAVFCSDQMEEKDNRRVIQVSRQQKIVKVINVGCERRKRELQ